MSWVNKVMCLFNDSYCEPQDPDQDFDRRVNRIAEEQEEVETRLKALGTRVDVTIRSGEDGKVLVDVEREPDDGNS